LGGGERYALLRGNAGCFHSLILYSWPGIPIIWNRVFHTDRIPSHEESIIPHRE